MKSIHLKIYGRVQGVFFRQSTVEKAHQLRLTGTVRNCSDGTVEIEAEGKDEMLSVFVDWCRQGPSRANVRQVDIHERPLKNFAGFRISKDTNDQF